MRVSCLACFLVLVAIAVAKQAVYDDPDAIVWSQPNDGKLFYLNHDLLAWSDANRVCHEKQGRLLSIANVSTGNTVKDFLKHQDEELFWTGLTEDLFHQWSWDTAGLTLYTNWLPGQPYQENGAPGCGLVNKDGGWLVSDCEVARMSVCEKNADSPQSFTPQHLDSTDNDLIDSEESGASAEGSSTEVVQDDDSQPYNTTRMLRRLDRLRSYLNETAQNVTRNETTTYQPTTVLKFGNQPTSTFRHNKELESKSEIVRLAKEVLRPHVANGVLYPRLRYSRPTYATRNHRSDIEHHTVSGEHHLVHEHHSVVLRRNHYEQALVRDFINDMTVKTTGGNGNERVCVFPFISNGKTNFRCLKSRQRSDKKWCAVTSNYDRDMRWGYCVFLNDPLPAPTVGQQPKAMSEKAKLILSSGGLKPHRLVTQMTEHIKKQSHKGSGVTGVADDNTKQATDTKPSKQDATTMLVKPIESSSKKPLKGEKSLELKNDETQQGFGPTTISMPQMPGLKGNEKVRKLEQSTEYLKDKFGNDKVKIHVVKYITTDSPSKTEEHSLTEVKNEKSDDYVMNVTIEVTKKTDKQILDQSLADKVSDGVNAPNSIKTVDSKTTNDKTDNILTDHRPTVVNALISSPLATASDKQQNRTDKEFNFLLGHILHNIKDVSKSEEAQDVFGHSSNSDLFELINQPTYKQSVQLTRNHDNHAAGMNSLENIEKALAQQIAPTVSTPLLQQVESGEHLVPQVDSLHTSDIAAEKDALQQVAGNSSNGITAMTEKSVSDQKVPSDGVELLGLIENQKNDTGSVYSKHYDSEEALSFDNSTSNHVDYLRMINETVDGTSTLEDNTNNYFTAREEGKQNKSADFHLPDKDSTTSPPEGSNSFRVIKESPRLTTISESSEPKPERTVNSLIEPVDTKEKMEEIKSESANEKNILLKEDTESAVLRENRDKANNSVNTFSGEKPPLGENSTSMSDGSLFESSMREGDRPEMLIGGVEGDDNNGKRENSATTSHIKNNTFIGGFSDDTATPVTDKSGAVVALTNANGAQIPAHIAKHNVTMDQHVTWITPLEVLSTDGTRKIYEVENRTANEDEGSQTVTNKSLHEEEVEREALKLTDAVQQFVNRHEQQQNNSGVYNTVEGFNSEISNFVQKVKNATSITKMLPSDIRSDVSNDQPSEDSHEEKLSALSEEQTHGENEQAKNKDQQLSITKNIAYEQAHPRLSSELVREGGLHLPEASGKRREDVNNLNAVEVTDTQGTSKTFGGNSNGRPCAFPFVYDGESYWSCIKIPTNTVPWCATTSSYDVMPMWGFCCKGVDCPASDTFLSASKKKQIAKTIPRKHIDVTRLFLHNLNSKQRVGKLMKDSKNFVSTHSIRQSGNTLTKQQTAKAIEPKVQKSNESRTITPQDKSDPQKDLKQKSPKQQETTQKNKLNLMKIRRQQNWQQRKMLWQQKQQNQNAQQQPGQHFQLLHEDQFTSPLTNVTSQQENPTKRATLGVYHADVDGVFGDFGEFYDVTSALMNRVSEGHVIRDAEIGQRKSVTKQKRKHIRKGERRGETEVETGKNVGISGERKRESKQGTVKEEQNTNWKAIRERKGSRENSDKSKNEDEKQKQESIKEEMNAGITHVPTTKSIRAANSFGAKKQRLKNYMSNKLERGSAKTIQDFNSDKQTFEKDFTGAENRKAKTNKKDSKSIDPITPSKRSKYFLDVFDTVKTSGGNSHGTDCAFPFVYDGQTHANCIGDIRGQRSWCATTHNFDRDAKWGLCCESGQFFLD